MNIQENLIQKLGLDDLNQEKKQQVLDQVNEAVLQRVFYATMEQLSEDDREILTQKIDDENTEAEDVDHFLRSAIANYDALVDGEIAKFVEEFEQELAKNEVN